MYKALLCAALLLGIASAAPADTLQLDYTVMGTGGLSGPIAGISNSSFWWTDTSGTISGSVLANYGFAPITSILTPSVDVSSYQGSLLLSSSFTLTAGQTLNVTTTAMTNQSSPFYELDFAVLLQNSQAVAVLSNISPNGLGEVGDFGQIENKTLPSAGVSTVLTRSADQVDAVGTPFTLGASTYNGPLTNSSQANMSAQIMSSYTPGAGTYQLLFGAFDAPAFTRESALAVQSVSVSMPEEGTGEDLIASGLLMSCVGLMFIYKRNTQVKI